MADWICLEDLDPRQARPLQGVKVAGHRLCLVQRAGRWYALGDRCPHAGGPLSAGFLNEGGAVVCPWHRIAFSPETGQAVQGGYFVRTYPVKEKAGRLWVQVSRPWWQRWFSRQK